MSEKKYKEFWLFDNGEEPHLAFSEPPSPDRDNVWPEECTHVIEKAAYREIDRKLFIAMCALSEIGSINNLTEPISYDIANNALKEIEK